MIQVCLAPDDNELVLHLTARSLVKDQLVIVGRKHTWIMSYIYIGTFGSFIDSAAFPRRGNEFPHITDAIATVIAGNCVLISSGNAAE